MKKRLKGCLSTLAAIVVILAIAGLSLKIYMRYARHSWKEAALPEIKSAADDPKWTTTEIEMIKNDYNCIPGADHWLSEKMILMVNGEWLVYKYHCNKVPPHLVTDIFLAKGSDGKWYYTTCHFCVGMCALTMMQEEPPKDISSFAKRYHIKVFDGVSDECLKPTKTFPDSF